MESNYVYLSINKVNGKCYIGSHKTLNKNDSYFGSGIFIKNAIKKEGKENFLKIILKEFENIIDARIAEKEYIEKFDTVKPNGYNISPTGGPSNGGHSEESKAKISKNNKGKNNGKKPWLGKSRDKKTRDQISKSLEGNTCRLGIPCTEEALQNIRRSLIGKMEGDKNGFFNKSHSQESKDKISQSLKGKPSGNKGKKGRKTIRKICEHCGKNIAMNIYIQHHGEKCKQRNI